MTPIYRVTAKQKLHPANPLHVSRFYEKERLHRRKMQDRQDLILYIAQLYQHAIRSPRGFNEVKLRLTALRDWVYDFRPVLDYFFEVRQLGYNVNDDVNEITTLIPRRLHHKVHEDVERARLAFDPGERPDGVISKVHVLMQDEAELVERLKAEGHHALIEPTRWLLSIPGGEVNFVFRPAGKLQQRDTSIWPVAAVETWPSWLREKLFGPGIDIEAAYTQYLVRHLRLAYADKPKLYTMLFPDLERAVTDKQAWRLELCEVLGLKPTNDAINLVKTVCMSLANGSKISPSLLTNGTSYSITADIIVRQVPDLTIDKLQRIGQRLQRIAKQYSSAKKVICSHLLSLNPTRQNQKKVFSSYFEWERAARYLIWESIDRHGIMVHDGIDGVPRQYLERLPELIDLIGLRLS
jgi:hypothetical protein